MERLHVSILEFGKKQVQCYFSLSKMNDSFQGTIRQMLSRLMRPIFVTLGKDLN